MSWPIVFQPFISMPGPVSPLGNSSRRQGCRPILLLSRWQQKWCKANFNKAQQEDRKPSCWQSQQRLQHPLVEAQAGGHALWHRFRV